MKRVLLTAVALLFGAAAFAQPSASVETLAQKYADRDGALVMRLDSTMVGLVKLRVAALPDSLRRSAALLDKVSGMTNIMLMTGLARTLDPAADTTAFVRLESDFRADLAALTADPRAGGCSANGRRAWRSRAITRPRLRARPNWCWSFREAATRRCACSAAVSARRRPCVWRRCSASSCSVAAVRDRARRATERKNLAVFSACREKSLLLCHLIVLLRCKPIFW